jgi:hypothetical protein
VVVENAMTAAADNLARLGMHIKNDRGVMNSYSNGYKEFLSLYNRNKAVSDSLVQREPYTDEKIKLFVPEGSPLSREILKDLLNSGNAYNTWSEGMFENLNRILADGSIYPEKDRVDIIELYQQYIEEYTNICYLKMQLVILPLNVEGRKPLLDELPYMAVFGDKFTAQPFINNQAELEGALKAEKVKLQDISSKLQSYGMKGQ